MSTYVEDERSLERLCERLGAAPSFGIDIEFQRERTYFPRLCLIQVSLPDGWSGSGGDGGGGAPGGGRGEAGGGAPDGGRGEAVGGAPGPDNAPGQCAIIDPLRVRKLDPLWKLVGDPAIEKILHAARQDLEIVHEQGGVVPKNIFDTQIAAALIGVGDQPGYATLVEKFAGVKLSKLETVTDWSRRPLTPGQIEYALDDVRYLHRMRAAIGRRLAALGRTEWAREETGHFEDAATYNPDLSKLYLRLPRVRSLGRRNMAVARALAEWREEEAMRRDEPRGRVLSDEVIVEIAKRLPKSVAQLEILRGLHPNEARRSGPALIDVVAGALELTEADWPEPPPIPAEDPDRALVVDLLEVFLRSRAKEAEIGPSYLGGKQDLVALVEHVRGRRDPARGEPQLLSGWRKELVGNDLVEIATGRVNLHVDADSGRVTTSAR
jgi:ribonuclease D